MKIERTEVKLGPMKNILILSENKNWKAEMALIFARESKIHSFRWTYVSTRTDIISELSMRYFDAVVLHTSMPAAHLEIIFKYLSTTDYLSIPLFFLTDRFEDFKPLLNQQNFSHLTILATPIEAELIVKEILNKLFPPQTQGPGDADVKINLEFLKVFIDSTKYILESFCQFSKVEHSRPYLYNTKAPTTFAIEGTIELKSSFFVGEFNIGFTKETYLEILRLVLSQESLEINSENEDFAGEIVNMIYGQAKNILNTSGHNFDKVIPTYKTNPSIHQTKNPIVVVPLQTDAGIVELLIEIKKFKSA